MLDAESPHHDAGGIESIAVMEAKLTPEQFCGFLLGNVLKYALRANFKTQWKSDIRKCLVYAGKLNDVVNGKRTEEVEKSRDNVKLPKDIPQVWPMDKSPNSHPIDVLQKWKQGQSVKALQVIYKKDIEAALSEVSIPHHELVDVFLVTHFNYLSGKWEGRSNPELETLMKAAELRQQQENHGK